MDPRHRAEPPVPATGLLVDLRNFTPSLNAAGEDARGTNRFCHFLAEFYAVGLEACTIALPPALRATPPLSVSSTGDGLLVVYMGPRHHAHALMAAFLLEAGLRRCCEARNRTHERSPTVGFGVGIESGEVSQVSAKVGSTQVTTVIGHCVNIGARIEALTKVISSARVVIGDTTIERCTEDLFGTTFAKLRRAEQAAPTDEARVDLQKQMNDMNRALCLTFLDRYSLKGVDDPMPLYRLDDGAMGPRIDRFDSLLRGLCGDDPAHLEEIRGYLFSV